MDLEAGEEKVNYNKVLKTVKINGMSLKDTAFREKQFEFIGCVSVPD